MMRVMNAARVERWLKALIEACEENLVAGARSNRAECPQVAEHVTGNYRALRLTFPDGSVFDLQVRVAPRGENGNGAEAQPGAQAEEEPWQAEAVLAEIRGAGWHEFAIEGRGIMRLELRHMGLQAFISPARLDAAGEPETWAGFVDVLDTAGNRGRLVFTERNDFDSAEEVREELERMVVALVVSGEVRVKRRAS